MIKKIVLISVVLGLCAPLQSWAGPPSQEEEHRNALRKRRYEESRRRDPQEEERARQRARALVDAAAAAASLVDSSSNTACAMEDGENRAPPTAFAISSQADFSSVNLPPPPSAPKRPARSGLPTEKSATLKTTVQKVLQTPVVTSRQTRDWRTCRQEAGDVPGATGSQ